MNLPESVTIIKAKVVETRTRESEGGSTKPGPADEAAPSKALTFSESEKPRSHSVPQYHTLKEQIAAEADKVRHGTSTAYNQATVVKHKTSWFTPQHICREKCCATTVAISLDQDDHKIINTLDGFDLADINLQHYEMPDHLQFHATSLNEAMLPCLQNGTIIHLENHRKILRYFFGKIRPQITTPYVLMTTGSDADSPLLSFAKRLATDDLMIKWYGSNPRVWPSHDDPHDKLVPFPLGLSGKNKPQEKYLSRYLNMTNYTNPFLDTSRWKSRQNDLSVDDVFVKFGLNPNSKKHRQPVLDALCGNRTSPDGISCSTNYSNPGSVYAAASKYLFGASPPGAGYDCYRTYELLLLGVIPIIEHRHQTSKDLFQGLPVVQMKKDVQFQPHGEAFVKAAKAYVDSDEFRDGALDGWERLFLRYWRRRMLRDAGREGDIVSDERGREYYQAWQYTLTNEEPVLCSIEGNCEVT